MEPEAALLNGSWWELLFHPVLVPVHVALVVGAVLAWVVTTPLRDVGWTLMANLCALCWKHVELSLRVAEGYVAVIKDDELRALQTGEYLWALFEAIFAVPMEVIEARKEEYGAYGVLAFKGWDFLRELWCVYVPDTLQQLCSSSCCYAWGWLNACVASYRRAHGLVSGAFWAIMLVLAVCVYVPLTVLRVLEVLLRGWKGVLITLLLVNMAGWYYQWGVWVSYFTVVGVVLAVILVVLKEFGVGEKFDKIAPGRVAKRGWKHVRDEARTRRAEERTALRELRGGTECSPTPTGKEDQGTASPALPERSPSAIQAELRQQKQRVEELEREYKRNERIRRGRLNLRRGECPAPQAGDDGNVELLPEQQV